MKRKLLYILCLIMVFTTACGKVTEQTVTESEKPPALVVIKGEKEYGTTMGSYDWTVNGNTKKVDMPWPPVFPERPVPVEEGEEITFTLKGFNEKPEKANLKLLPKNVFGYADRYEKEQIIVTDEIEDFIEVETGIEFKFVLPMLDKYQYERDFILETELTWTDSEEVSDSTIYYARFMICPDKVVNEIISTAEAFREAAWEGNKEEAGQYMTTSALNAMNNDKFVSQYSFVSANIHSGWDYLLWRDEDKEFERMSQPLLEIESIGPQRDGPHASIITEYQVKVKEEGDNHLWYLKEEYYLQNENGHWKISGYNRSGIPVDSKTGQLGWKVSTEKDDRVIKIGPFSNINLYFSRWTSNGEYGAFIGGNFGVKELWTGEISTGKFKRMFRLEPDDKMPSELLVLRVKDEGNVVFMVNGYINSGDYKGQQGFWILEGDNSATHTIAFVPVGRADYFNSYKITEDGKYLFIQKTGDLYKINLQDGTHKIIRKDMPNYLTRVHYNQEGTLMAWEKRRDRSLEILVYDPIEESEITLKSPFEGMRIDLQGIYGDLIGVSLCRPENVQQGEDGDWPVGVEKILFYSFDGEVKKEITAPENQYIHVLNYNEQDEDMYYTAGKIRTKEYIPGDSCLYIYGKGLYRWLQDTSETEYITRIDGQIIEVQNIPVGRVFWYSYEYEPDGNSTQKGFVFDDQGNMETVERDHRYDAENEYYLLQSRDSKYVRVFNSEEGITYIKEISKDGEKVLTSGPFIINDYRIAGNNAVFVTDSSQLQPYPSKAYLYIVITE